MNTDAPSPFTPEGLARALVRLRDDVRLSQRRLGDLADVSNTAISALEAGSAPPPHPTMLWKLARGLATRPNGTIDETAADDAYSVLMQSAGYVHPPRSNGDDTALDAQLAQVRANLTDLDPEVQDALIAGWLGNLRLIKQARDRATG